MKCRNTDLFLLLMVTSPWMTSPVTSQQMQGVIRSDNPRMLNVQAPPGMASLVRFSKLLQISAFLLVKKSRVLIGQFENLWKAFVFDTTGSMWDDLEKGMFFKSKNHISGPKWTVMNQSGRSVGVKMDGHFRPCGH